MINRIGKIIISEIMFTDEIEDLAEVFSLMKFVPMRVERMYNHVTEMIGYSHMFEIIDVGLAAPEYIIEITKNEDETISIKVEGV